MYLELPKLIGDFLKNNRDSIVDSFLNGGSYMISFNKETQTVEMNPVKAPPLNDNNNNVSDIIESGSEA